MFSDIAYRTADAVNAAMGRVYGYMAMAVAVSMAVAAWVGSSPELVTFFFTGAMHWVVIFLPLVAVFALVPFMGTGPSRSAALLALAAFAAVMGLSFAVIFAVYTAASMVSAFMGAFVLFAVMSVYGYFTKRDLTTIGQFLFVGLIAILIVSIINLFIGSSALAMAVSAIAIVIFLGLTAYDTQTIREQLVYDRDDPAVEVMGALTLYLDFINLFLNLLQLFGVRKD
jgi:FtsH-binding integral membrane protein